MKVSVKFKHDRQFNNRIKNYLEQKKIEKKFKMLNKFGQEGVDALQAATPVLTGKTANSWYYRITKVNKSRVNLVWYNMNINDGVNIALLIDSGHATRSGTWVQGYNYIEPAIQPIMDKVIEYFREEGK